MPRITNWRRESRSPTLAYRNTETGARAVLHRVPDSYRYKWRAAILVDGYPVWSRGFETKEATTFRDVLRDKPTPELTCPECPNGDVVVGQKSADSAKVQRWFDCPECGYEERASNCYHGHWSRPNRLFSDPPEENSIDSVPTTGSYHDGVDLTRFNTLSDHLRRRPMFNVRLDVCQIVFIGVRDHLVDSLSCRALKFVRRECRASVRTLRRIIHDRKDVDRGVERRRERQARVVSATFECSLSD